MRKYVIWPVAVSIGIVVALLLRVFELCVNEGTDEIWNQLLHSDTHRWVVIPLATLLSVMLSFIIQRLDQKRVVRPENDILETINVGPASLKRIGIILAIGFVSLLAGASLGPEAALMASSAAIGAWAAQKTNLQPRKQLLVLASVGGLLVAFLGSCIMVLIPLLLLWRKKQLHLQSALIILITGVSSFITLQIIDHEQPGYGSMPAIPGIMTHDFLVAFIIGCVTTVIALGMNKLINQFGIFAERTTARTSWIVSATLFGLVLGVLYFFGGQSTEFSGSAGSSLLLKHSASYGFAALVGLIVIKLLATSWSKATGYRGGLVFPSIYIGVALGLLVGQLNGAWGGAGALTGGIAGMLSAVTGSPVVAAIFVLAILPIRSVGVAMCAIIGSVIGTLLLKRLVSKGVTKA